MREVLAYSLLVVTSALLLAIMIGVVLHGTFILSEPCYPLAIFEVVLLTTILALGIERLMSAFRRKR